jgi:mutual gliding-motility protein MglA
MALINVAKREIHCKIVYYGPGMGGKTSNLQYIHSQVPKEAKGDLLSIATETERTLFFDFLPLDLGKVRGFQTRFHLYTVPGQVLYERTRVAVLNGTDGVVFVADSRWTKMKENVDSLRELHRNMTEHQNKDFVHFPIVLQYNKRDLPERQEPGEGFIAPISELDRFLNAKRPIAKNEWNELLARPEEYAKQLRWQRCKAVASQGTGVFDTLKAISRLVISKL